jgi:hypothetical protein
LPHDGRVAGAAGIDPQYAVAATSQRTVLKVVSSVLVGIVLENGFLRLQQLDHPAEFLRPYVA